MACSNAQKYTIDTEMVNPVEALKNILWDLVLENDNNKSRPVAIAAATSMIRLHTEKLATFGDFSLVCNLNIWQEVLSSFPGLQLTKTAQELFALPENDNDNASQNFSDLIPVSSLFPVELFDFQNGRCIGFLQRPIVIRNMIHIILEQASTYGQHIKKSTKIRIKLLPYEPPDVHFEIILSYYRALLLYNVMAKLLKYSSWVLVEEDECCGEIMQVQIMSVTQQPEFIVSNNGQRYCLVKCGVVLSPDTGKIVQMTAQEYNKLRANDMLLLARHKYGLRTKCDEGFMAHIADIGKAAATVDLLEVKHSSPVHTKFNGQGSTRGASFILYNSARLENLLHIFDERVRLGKLPALPNISEIDFTLLCEEEEWQLLYAYLFTFPQLIENCLENLEKHSLCGVHLIVRYLSSFVGIFSAYYHRVRILTEPRVTLLPVLFARIYLLKAVRIVLNKGLELLDIQHVNFM